MKLRYLFFTVFLCLFLLTIDVSAQGAGCNGGKRNGVYYTDCFPKSATDTNDWLRLQYAINTITGSAGTGSGKLIFNEGTYTVDRSITLNSNLILEGTSVNTSAGSVSSLITLTASNQSIFLIPESVVEVSIRDIGLSASSSALTGTVGIEGINQTNSDPKKSSAKIQLSNLRFQDFTRGIYVHTLGDLDLFQFDSVRLDHATFVNCGIGVEIDASDSGWAITNVNIVSKPSQHGIFVTKGGYISMNLIVGNAEPNSTGTFIKISNTSNLSIQNSVNENYLKGLDIDSSPLRAKLVPIALINNAFGDAVTINNATVVSTGNFYGNYTKVALPLIKGKSDVFSIGDTFCWAYLTAKQYCAGSKFVVQGNSATLQQMGGIDDLTVVNEKDANGDEILNTAARPAFKVIEPKIGKTLIALGNVGADGTEFVYRLKRDSQGRLSFIASQTDPWKGYNFDGPIRLKSYTFEGAKNSLASMTGTASTGDMVYCADCKANATTSVCEGGGTGKLALVVGSQWICK
jgi:hypothetical protein